MAGAINNFTQNVSLSEDGSIIDITVTNNGAADIVSPGFYVTAVYVDGTNQYIRALKVDTLDASDSVTFSLSINGASTYNEENLHVGIGFVHTIT